MTSGPVFRWSALLAVWLGAAGSADAAIEIVGQTHATFAWHASAGPVAGYYVYVMRNGAPPSLHSIVIDANSQTIYGNVGDTVQVSTSAFDEQGNPRQ